MTSHLQQKLNNGKIIFTCYAHALHPWIKLTKLNKKKKKIKDREKWREDNTFHYSFFTYTAALCVTRFGRIIIVCNLAHKIYVYVYTLSTCVFMHYTTCREVLLHSNRKLNSKCFQCSIEINPIKCAFCYLKWIGHLQAKNHHNCSSSSSIILSYADMPL